MSVCLLEEYMRDKLSTFSEYSECLIRINKCQLYAKKKIELILYKLQIVIINESIDSSRIKSLGKFFIEFTKTKTAYLDYKNYSNNFFF